MSKIDLRYIDAEGFTHALASDELDVDCLMDMIEHRISEDYHRAKGYLNKYDNVWDMRAGTDVSELKREVENIDKNLKLLKELLKCRNT